LCVILTVLRISSRFSVVDDYGISDNDFHLVVDSSWNLIVI
jgi:hypothetical protein